MTFGLTPNGFNAPRLADVKQFLENDFIASLGDVNTDPQSVAGQLIGIFSKVYADLWENLEDVYLSQYPNSAAGSSLDNVVQLNGITRLPATQTSVIATCDGLEGTFIPINSQARTPGSGQVFASRIGATITSQNADIVTIATGALTTQSYSVIVSNVTYTYSRPTIVFSNAGNIFVTGNVIVVTLNGVQLTAVPFNSNSNQTLSDIRAQIILFSTVFSAVVTNPDTITITSKFGQNTVINSISITGGASQASSIINFRAPDTNPTLAVRLRELINFSSPSYTAVSSGNNIIITANDASVPFSCVVGQNLSIIQQASPIEFLALDFGPIACPIQTLTEIVTPIGGWNSITNYLVGNTGTLIETDAQLRIRRQNSIKLLGSATVEAITAGLLQKVSGVTSALVFENTSLQQTNIIISFPGQFSSGDVITVIYNSVNNLSVNFTTNQITTMTALVAAFVALPQVASAFFGGTGNQVLTVVMNISTVLTVNSASTNVSSLTAAINGGRPPKSFEAVVEGGTNEAIASQIWLTKPAGIETFGNVNNGDGIPIVDSQGNTQTIFFSRPSPIYIWVQVALTLYSEETFPVNGLQNVALAIFNYGSSLGVGVDVLLQRVLAQIFVVSGIASGNMTIAATNLPTDSPSFGSLDIAIQENQVSVFDLQRISVTVA